MTEPIRLLSVLLSVLVNWREGGEREKEREGGHERERERERENESESVRL